MPIEVIGGVGVDILVQGDKGLDVAGMAQVPCGARIGFLVAAIVFVIIQMRLYAAEQNYSLQATSAVVTEEECQMELRKLGDKLLTQQTTLAYLEEKKIQLEVRLKGWLVSLRRVKAGASISSQSTAVFSKLLWPSASSYLHKVMRM